MAESVLALGLMSGTSCDGVDVALLETDGERQIGFIAADTLPYDEDLRERLLEAGQRDVSLVELLRLERDVTREAARAVRRLLAENDVAREPQVVGFHGHTVRHVAAERLTWQIGNALLLAEELGMPVVSDFRRRDMATGGEGAPLAALYHAAVLAEQSKPCAVLNLGGVANITWLGADGEIIAGDTGPGCGLLDAWVRETADQPYDEDGKLAAAGRIHADRIKTALATPFFEKLLPKSADRFEFDGVIELEELSPADGAATLCGLTAEAAWLAAQELPEMPRHLWVTGGGARHPRIVQQLTARFAPAGCEVGNILELGLRPDSMEAECFAWLAVRRLRGLATSLPSTTGAMHATVGGVLTT
jgi:anhydro-N-acetylmuramic acid kinase